MVINSRILDKAVESLSKLSVEEKKDQDYLLMAIYSVGAAVAGALEDLTEEVKKLREAMSDGGRKEGA